MPTDRDIILATIAQQYGISKQRLYGTKLAAVVKEQVARLDRTRPGWTAKDFPWNAVLNDDETLREELLQPGEIG